VSCVEAIAAAAPAAATTSVTSDGTSHAATEGARLAGTIRLPHSRQYSWPGSAGAPQVRQTGATGRFTRSALRELGDRRATLELGGGLGLDGAGIGAHPAARTEAGVGRESAPARRAGPACLGDRATARRAELGV